MGNEESKLKDAEALVKQAERTASRGHADKLAPGWVLSSSLMPSPIQPDRLREAVGLYSQAIALVPKGYWMYQQALLLMDLGQFDEASAAFSACAKQGDYVDSTMVGLLIAQCESLKQRDASSVTPEDVAHANASILKQGMGAMFGNIDPALGKEMDALLGALISNDDVSGPDYETVDVDDSLTEEQVQRICDFGEAFAWMLVNGQFDRARNQLTPDLQATWTGEALNEEYTSMVEYIEEPIDSIEALPPDKADDALATVYVSIASDDIFEAVFLTLVEVNGQLAISDLEWGRP